MCAGSLIATEWQKNITISFTNKIAQSFLLIKACDVFVVK